MDITKDHVAIVTGGASGLGAATVAALRDAGAQVVIFDMNADMGEEHATATGASFMRVDVSNADEVAKSIEQVVADHGALHIAVNSTPSPSESRLGPPPQSPVRVSPMRVG
mgnify:CR=1 FL=1